MRTPNGSRRSIPLQNHYSRSDAAVHDGRSNSPDDEGYSLEEVEAVVKELQAAERLDRNDRKSNSNRRPSVIRDAPFILHDQGISGATAKGGAGGGSVGIPTTPTAPSLTPPTAPCSTTPADTFGSYATRIWRQFDVPPERIKVRHRAPASWRDVSELCRLTFYGRALRSLGPVHAFTLNLRDDIELEALRQPSPANWLRDRIKRRLEQALGRPVDFYLVIEDITDQGRRLHVHGAMGVNDNEVARARLALRRAGGEWKEMRQHQAETKPDPDDGWPAYCAKFRGIHGRYVGNLLRRYGGRHHLPTFTGPWFAATRPVGQRAQGIYEADRKGLMKTKAHFAYIKR